MKKLISPLTAMLLLTGCKEKEAVSIGIIGGADGPTAVYMAGKINWWGVIAGIIALAGVIAAAVWLYKTKEKK